jgi:hypothetical protein
VSNLLPWHPRRLNDEILSSWILRVAAGNNVSVRSLCAWLGNDQPVAALDRMAHTSPLMDSIAEGIGVEKEQIIECLPSSLHGLSRTPVYRPRGAAPMPWCLWQGSYGVMGNQYCPTCLGEKGHHQLPWSIAIYTCCLRHSCFLRESCPHCGKPFRSASRFLNSSLVNPEKDLQRCAYCNRSVDNCAPSERADKRTLRLCHVLGSLATKSSCESFFGCWRDFSTLCAVRLPQRTT